MSGDATGSRSRNGRPDNHSCYGSDECTIEINRVRIDSLLSSLTNLRYSYHQKYRLQSHKGLVKALGLDSPLLQTSHVAARLNGYLVGIGGLEQFLKEADHLGLDPEQREYVKRHVIENEGGNLYC